MILRPHHGMCFQFYEGKGYSEEFTDHMGRVIAFLDSDPETEITVSARTDEVCGNCPNNSDGICDSEEKVNRYDMAVLEACNMKDGDVIRYSDFLKQVKEKIIDTGFRCRICGDCGWNDICSKR